MRELLRDTFPVYPRSDKSVAMTSKAKIEKGELPQVTSAWGAERVRPLEGEMTGRALIELLQQSPLRDLCIEYEGVRMPVRDVEL